MVQLLRLDNDLFPTELVLKTIHTAWGDNCFVTYILCNFYEYVTMQYAQAYTQKLAEYVVVFDSSHLYAPLRKTVSVHCLTRKSD